MKLSEGLLKKINQLLLGHPVPYSSLQGDWVDTLVGEGVLVREFHGSRRNYRISDKDSFLSALADVDERFRIIELLMDDLGNMTLDRSRQAADTGNSKMVKSRSCPGFPVNSWEPIVCQLNGKEFIVAPEPGEFTFVCDWKEFHIPADVTVIGIENMENFRLIRDQGAFLAPLADGMPILFVSRFPQSKDLGEWLKGMPNKYIHFGDFDLAGIKIYETEFAVHLRDNAKDIQRCSMFIPADIEERLRAGVRKRYDDQLPECQSLSSPDPEVQRLLSLIHKYRRGYDQEGYIHSHPK